jgi:hypothetical protein
MDPKIRGFLVHKEQYLGGGGERTNTKTCLVLGLTQYSILSVTETFIKDMTGGGGILNVDGRIILRYTIS